MIMEETIERKIYRMKCKYYVESVGGCSKHLRDGWHFFSDCCGYCRRMKNYDKKIKKQKEKE